MCTSVNEVVCHGIPDLRGCRRSVGLGLGLGLGHLLPDGATTACCLQLTLTCASCRRATYS